MRSSFFFDGFEPTWIIYPVKPVYVTVIANTLAVTHTHTHTYI